MHNGKYRRKRKKWVMLTVAMLLLLAAGVGGSIAYLLDKTDMVNNTFTPGRVTVDIAEEKTPTTKSNIRVQNTGNVPAYIRVTLVTYWTDADNKVVPQPDGGSVSTPSVKPGWSCADNIYYYNSSVAPGDLTDAMLVARSIQYLVYHLVHQCPLVGIAAANHIVQGPRGLGYISLLILRTARHNDGMHLDRRHLAVLGIAEVVLMNLHAHLRLSDRLDSILLQVPHGLIQLEFVGGIVEATLHRLVKLLAAHSHHLLDIPYLQRKQSEE